MNEAKEKKIRKTIKALLIKNGIFERGIDEQLIEEYIENLNDMELAKEMKGQGLLIPRYGKDSTVMIKNPAFIVYNDAFKNLRAISEKLGLTPADRMKLATENRNKESKKDGFDM